MPTFDSPIATPVLESPLPTPMPSPPAHGKQVGGGSHVVTQFAAETPTAVVQQASSDAHEVETHAETRQPETLATPAPLIGETGSDGLTMLVLVIAASISLIASGLRRRMRK